MFTSNIHIINIHTFIQTCILVPPLKVITLTMNPILLHTMDMKLYQPCIPYSIHILCTIHYYQHVLFLNLICQGPFRRNWVTWPRSLSWFYRVTVLFWVYRITVFQVRSVSYHDREVGCCCMQWSPIAFYSKATHFIWICSVRVHSGGSGQPDLAH